MTPLVIRMTITNDATTWSITCDRHIDNRNIFIIHSTEIAYIFIMRHSLIEARQYFLIIKSFRMLDNSTFSTFCFYKNLILLTFSELPSVRSN
jgi:hypothetical protein